MLQHLFEYFNNEGHHCFLDETSITFIDKTDSTETLTRKNNWMSEYP